MPAFQKELESTLKADRNIWNVAAGRTPFIDDGVHFRALRAAVESPEAWEALSMPDVARKEFVCAGWQGEEFRVGVGFNHFYVTSRVGDKTVLNLQSSKTAQVLFKRINAITSGEAAPEPPKSYFGVERLKRVDEATHQLEPHIVKLMEKLNAIVAEYPESTRSKITIEPVWEFVRSPRGPFEQVAAFYGDVPAADWKQMKLKIMDVAMQYPEKITLAPLTEENGTVSVLKVYI